MGGVPSNMWQTWTNRENQPDRFNPPTFDPMLGFPEGRKPREMKVTSEEMEAANLPLPYRDYCAHEALNFIRCRKDKEGDCSHHMHHWHDCQYEDYVLRMKEYEREKRLIRKRNAQQKEML